MFAQVCPFTDCFEKWVGDIYIKNLKADKILIVNEGTVHLARSHHFLEKCEKFPYAISPLQFFDLFMPSDENKPLGSFDEPVFETLRKLKGKHCLEGISYPSLAELRKWDYRDCLRDCINRALIEMRGN